jgi:hypothetical protein
MKIKFIIDEMPKADQMKYLIAYLSGELVIVFDDVVFFKEQDILLAEFAVCSFKWLNKVKSGKYENFVYESMDHDEPIIQMNYISNEGYKIYSLWECQSIDNLHSAEEIAAGLEGFIERFSKELLIRYNINLDSIVN